MLIIQLYFEAVYSAPLSASTISILRFFRATIRLTSRETPKHPSSMRSARLPGSSSPASGKSQMGYASALAWIMLLIVSLVTIFLFWTRKKWVYDG